MNTDIYSKNIWCRQDDQRMGGTTKAFSRPAGDLESDPILKAFLDNDDVQEITMRGCVDGLKFYHSYLKIINLK